MSKLDKVQPNPQVPRGPGARNLKKEKQERNRAYARKFKKRKMRNDGRGEGAGNGVTGTANNGGAAD